ncbi:unnamed protein product [Mytilus edulis]|uniref:IgGFc-binding protein N-terminal domain-containing protein n=1 Tax=Mytilus edulis TaxID=6550 RepID=A0A8S3UB77_MYTED|nr:unnamed protein product [Mytilus edulis]
MCKHRPKSCQQKRSGPTPSRTCIECCSKDLCNIEGCGELDHGNRTGLLCHNCKGLLASEKCEHVKECYINEMCFIEEGVSFGESFFTSGCKETHVCPKNIDANPFFGKRTVRGLCSQCCSGDLCNNQCKIGSSTSAPNDEVMGNMFYLTYSVNTVGAQLVLTSIGIARCNLTRSDQSLVKNIVVNGSSIYNINETLNKHLLVFKLHCDLGVILYVVERSISIPGLDAYLVLPTKSLSTQYLVPSYNQTNDGTSDTKYVEVDNPNMTSIVSSCPSMVHFYSHKTSHQRSFMTLIPGLDQYLSHYYFRTPNYSCSLLLIINKAYISNLRLDESMVSTGMIVEIQEPVNHYDNNAVFTITIDKGRHEAKQPMAPHSGCGYMKPTMVLHTLQDLVQQKHKKSNQNLIREL